MWVITQNKRKNRKNRYAGRETASSPLSKAIRFVGEKDAQAVIDLFLTPDSFEPEEVAE